MAAATALAASRSCRYVMATRAPCRPNNSAVARPIPLELPVTSATRSVNPRSIEPATGSKGARPSGLQRRRRSARERLDPLREVAKRDGVDEQELQPHVDVEHRSNSIQAQRP